MHLQPDRYLDTAAIGFLARRAELPTEKICRRLTLILPKGAVCFFSSNTTRVIETFLQWSRETTELPIEMSGRLKPHPVVHTLLTRYPGASTPSSQSIKFVTYMDWLTGAIDDTVALSENPGKSGSFTLVDAAQALGCLDSARTFQLLSLAKDSIVVCGCLQKWLGSPVPVGFAILDLAFLENNPGLCEFLAARDYLGTGIGERVGFDSFPDSFSTSIARIASNALSLLSIDFAPALDELAGTIATNRDWIHREVSSVSTLEVLGQTNARGIVAVSGASEYIERVSLKLNSADFTHSMIQSGSPNSPTRVLRLSAPTVMMSRAAKCAFSSILKNG